MADPQIPRQGPRDSEEPIMESQVEAIWTVLIYVVFPALAASYGLTLGCLKWMWGELKETRQQDLRDIKELLVTLTARVTRGEQFDSDKSTDHPR